MRAGGITQRGGAVGEVFEEGYDAKVERFLHSLRLIGMTNNRAQWVGVVLADTGHPDQPADITLYSNSYHWP